MKRPWVTALALLVAFLIERAIVPQCGVVLGPTTMMLLGLRLMTLVIILGGMLHGPLKGALWGAGAGLLYAFSLYPGALGVSLISFSLVGWLAGWLEEHFGWHGVALRGFSILGLLLLERLVWNLVMKFFWPAAPMEPALEVAVACGVTGLLGVILYGILKLRWRSFS